MKTTLLSLVTVFGLMTFIGCSNTQTGPIESEAIYTTMVVNSDGSISEQPIETPKPDAGKKVTPSPFVDLLRILNLTPEQKTIVETLLKQHKECTQSCIETLKTAEREILINSRQSRQSRCKWSTRQPRQSRKSRCNWFSGQPRQPRQPRCNWSSRQSRKPRCYWCSRQPRQSR